MHKLLAIVEVDESERVRCQQAGCGHAVFKRIHVVQEDDSLLVLGSTCFAKRYGSGDALGESVYQARDGKTLTAEERELLISNTQALLAQFEREKQIIEEFAQAEREEQKKLAEARNSVILSQLARLRPKNVTPSIPAMPWHWVKPMSSMAYFHCRDGTGWIRVQDRQSRQLVMPWPHFDGWDESMPASIGKPDSGYGGYMVDDVTTAIGYLRRQSEWEKIGVWSEIMTEIAKKSSVESF